jgi:hypothetical protein
MKLFTHIPTATRALTAAVIALVTTSIGHSQTLQWTHQFGTSSNHHCCGISADGLGNVYLAGYTYGSLGGTNVVGNEASLRKCNVAGNLQWTRQVGTSAQDDNYGGSADAQGNVYISGLTDGSLDGEDAGSGNSSISKYGAAGAVQWTRQLGCSATAYYGLGVSLNGLGNILLSGDTLGSRGGTNVGGWDGFGAKVSDPSVPELSMLLLSPLAFVPLVYGRQGVRNRARPRPVNLRFASFAITLLGSLAAAPARAVTLEWTQQLGTTADDASYGVTADRLGNVYISGTTYGSLGGPNNGVDDAFISKYNAAGSLQWTRQLGTSDFDESRCVSADGLGNVYISGITFGALGAPSAGGFDVYLSKYDAAGTLQWTRQLGSSGKESSLAVSADGLGNVYISGYTRYILPGQTWAGNDDAFLAKYNAAGNLQWTRQFGTSAPDDGNSVSADGLGNVYIAGTTSGSLDATNAGGNGEGFVRKYDVVGNLLWARQFGTGAGGGVGVNGVSADGLGDIYITGYTGGDLDGTNAGGVDAFVAKYDTAGNQQWTRQFGTSAQDDGNSVSSDSLGNVYIAGNTFGNLSGSNAGSIDAFVSKYDAAGNLQWTSQLGTGSTDVGSGVSADGQGSVYITGTTLGSLGGTNAGSGDAYVAKFSDSSVPEPSTLLVAALAIVSFSWRVRFRWHA